MTKGVPQGSIMGPFFNSFINDLFYFIHTTTLINYADDNTLSVAVNRMDTVKALLLENGQIAVDWFHKNKMEANPQKCQAIFLGGKQNDITLELCDHKIVSESSVKLVGVNINNTLNSETRIRRICAKASKQLNVRDNQIRSVSK